MPLASKLTKVEKKQLVIAVSPTPSYMKLKGLCILEHNLETAHCRVQWRDPCFLTEPNPLPQRIHFPVG